MAPRVALYPKSMLVGALVVSALPSVASALTLAPHMPEIGQPGVPLLWEAIPDADRTKADLHLTPPEPYRWVLDPGSALAIRAQGGPVDADRAVLTVWDWELRPVAQAPFATLPFDEAVPFEVEGRGTYLLTLDLVAGAKCTTRLVRSFAVCPSNLERRAVWDTDSFFVGTCSFPERQHWTNDFGPAHPPDLPEQDTRELDAALTARLGLQIVRLDMPTGVIWPAEDAPMSFDVVDACVRTVTAHGLKLDVQLSGRPDWMVLPKYAEVRDPKWRYPPREGPWRRYVAACAERYREHAAFFEVYNEPDWQDFWRGTPDEYIECCRWSVEEIRRHAPGAPIANGGYALCGEAADTGRIIRGVRGMTDWAAYHSHGTVGGLESAFRVVETAHAAAGYEEPVFVNTEMGYMAWRTDQERTMATTAVQKLLYCWAHGHRGALLYCSRDIGGPRGGDWGYLDHFMCPRFMYGAVAAFIDTFAGAQLDSVLAETPQLHAYLFRRGDDRLAALFAPDGERTVVLESDAPSATVIDPMGNPTPAASAQHVEVAAGAYPVAVRLTRATRVSLGQ